MHSLLLNLEVYRSFNACMISLEQRYDNQSVIGMSDICLKWGLCTQKTFMFTLWIHEFSKNVRCIIEHMCSNILQIFYGKSNQFRNVFFSRSLFRLLSIESDTLNFDLLYILRLHRSKFRHCIHNPIMCFV